MKIPSNFIIALFFIALSCKQKSYLQTPNISDPNSVEAKGYIVPRDSIAEPIIIKAGIPSRVLIGKPTIVPANKNIVTVVTPHSIKAGLPTIFTPGKGQFAALKKIKAVGISNRAGIPEVIMANNAGTKETNPFSFSYYSKLQGLKTNTISSLLEDKAGNLWFGTYGGGITKYDGRFFTTFTDKVGLSKNAVNCLMEDKSNNLWIGTNGGGVCRYDGTLFTNFTEKEGLSSNDVSCLLEDKNGQIWMGTNGGGLTMFDGQDFIHFTEKEGLSNNDVSSIQEDNNGHLWIGTSAGINKFDGHSFMHITKKEGLPDSEILSIQKDRNGNMWFGTDVAGIIKYDGQSFTVYTEKEGLSDNTVNVIHEDKNGNLWIGTDQGLNKFDGKSFTTFSVIEGISDHVITAIMEDKSENLWFGTSNGGVNKYDGRIFNHYTTNEGLSNNFINDILEDNKGNLWLGTFGKGINKYDGHTFSHFTKKEGLSNNVVSSIIQGKNGFLWIGTFDGGIMKFDGTNLLNFTKKEGLCDNTVSAMLEDKNGNIWIGTGDGGVSKFDGVQFFNYSTRQGLSSNAVWSIIEDHVGNIWFGTYGGGLTKFDGTSFTHFTKKEGLSHDDVSAIMEDHKGNIWVGTFGGGVNKFNGKSFTYYTEKEGLSNNVVLSILEEQDYIWFGTRFGLSRLSVASENKSTDQLLHNKETSGLNKSAILFKNFTYEDGLLSIGCNRNAIIKDKQGTIWIGTNNMLTAFHPAEIIPDTVPPNVQLTSISLYNEKLDWSTLETNQDTSFALGNGVLVHDFYFSGISRWYGLPENLALAYNNNFLNFNFVGITLHSPRKVKYQYRLKGLDEYWSAITNRTEVTYGNLPPGNYSLLVKAMNSEGFWSNELNYDFTILPPWWKTWWAYLIYILLFITALIQIDRFQKQRVIRVERQKSQLKELEQAKEIEKAYHELRSTQAQLIQSEKMASLGELTAGIAHEIQNPLNFVKNFSEVNKELLNDMKDELDKGNYPEARLIADNLDLNMEKINHHGLRADAIVKSMLQHSRSNSGQKELTDINSLADEYLRLAYHGFRGKDQTFNATIVTDFDKNIGLLTIIPQDIGRVLLNLYNNAFYAVATKTTVMAGKDYRPTVTVFTKLVSDIRDITGSKLNPNSVIITVRDNGMGIPDKVKAKIYQPFFTTKPTGAGTGLGLSLSYDIVKAHGGEIKHNSREGEYTEFIIQLPV